MDALFRPRSVAVIGASSRQPSIGWQLTHNIVDDGFQGALYPVHPTLEHLHSIKCYRDVRDIPGAVDLAVIALRQDRVRPAVEACIEKGVGGLIIISAGFREIGPKGAAEERELVALCREAGVRVIGPNCMGILNTDPSVSVNATFSRTSPPRGNVAFMSQSGALGEAILNFANRLGLGVSMFASVGNRADVSANDLLEYWGKDPSTDVVLLYLESFGNPRRFPEIASRVARDKAIIAVKAGGTHTGQRAAASHTGSLAGRDVATGALLRKGGVLRARTVSDMFHMARALANQPLPAGDRVVILTNAGGPGILAADALEAEGLSLPELAAEVQERIRPHVRPTASLANPLDLIADATAEHYEKALDEVLGSGAADLVLAIFVPPIVTDSAAVVRAIARAIVRARERGVEVPVLSVLMGEEGIVEGEADLKAARIPVYRFPEEAALAMGAMVSRARWLAQPRESLESLAKAAEALRTPEVDQLLSGQGPGMLDAAVARRLLAAFGVPILEAEQVEDARAAVAMLADGHVVLKAEGPSLIHKTELGAVRVDLRTVAEVREAFDDLKANVADPHPGSRIVAQRHVGGGREVLVGASRDPAFGPMIAFGAGGTDVEAVRDVVFRVAPLTEADAWEMVREIRAYPALMNDRRGKPADVAAAVTVLQAVSNVMLACPEVAAIDLNPVLLLPEGDGGLAVDARVERG